MQQENILLLNDRLEYTQLLPSPVTVVKMLSPTGITILAVSD